MNEIYYIIQLLYSINFTDDEIADLFNIIMTSIDRSLDVESQVSNSMNYKYIEAFSLIDDYDWYNISQSIRSYIPNSVTKGLLDSNEFILIDSNNFIIYDSTQ